MMPVIFASGARGRPLFVLRGKRHPYRVVQNGSDSSTETVFKCLPRGSMVAMREEVAGVDSYNFLRWADQFVEDVRPLTARGRKVLLIYDRYRSHMSLPVLRALRSGNVIAYCLPAHTCGVTHPLDLTVFGVFKRELGESIRNAQGLDNQDSSLDVLDFCNLMDQAYRVALKPDVIKAGFRRAGLWPSNPAAVLSVSIFDSNREGTVLGPNDIVRLLEQKRELARSGVGLQPAVLRRGFLDTTVGIVLTSEDAMKAVKAQEARATAKRLSAQAKKAAADAKVAAESLRRHHEFDQDAITRSRARGAL